jgi:hypothetical protein
MNPHPQLDPAACVRQVAVPGHALRQGTPVGLAAAREFGDGRALVGTIAAIIALVTCTQHTPAGAASRPGPAPASAPENLVNTTCMVRVLDARTGVRVGAFAVQRPCPSSALEPGRISWCFTTGEGARDGTFQLRPEFVHRGSVVFRVLANGYLPREVVLPAEDTWFLPSLDVELERGLTIRGRVTNRAGRPMPGALVFLAGPIDTTFENGAVTQGVPGGRLLTGDGGEFAIGGAVQGENTVVVVPPGEGPWLARVTDSSQPVEIRPPRPASLLIRYDIPHADPRARIRLQLLVPPGGRSGNRSVHVFHTVDVHNGGEARIDNVMPGEYEIVRRREITIGNVISGVGCDRQTLQLEAGQTRTIEIVRRQGVQITGVLSGNLTTPLAGGIVRVQPVGVEGLPESVAEIRFGNLDAAPVRADGSWRTCLIPPGEYLLKAEAYHSRDMLGRWFTGPTEPDYAGTARVVVPAGGDLAAIRIEMQPRAVPAASTPTAGSPAPERPRAVRLPG